MASLFLEILIYTKAALAEGIESRDEIEDPLAEALESSGLGEVMGGGAGMGKYTVDVGIGREEDLPEAILIIRRTLQGLQVPQSTVIRRGGLKGTIFPVYLSL